MILSFLLPNTGHFGLNPDHAQDPSKSEPTISHKPVRDRRLIVRVRECQQTGRAGYLVGAPSEFTLI